jgi:8-oxo-dGTP pyrophosphatase MutT (NUDIX family)
VRTVPRHLVEGERIGFRTGVEPKDASTLIIVDRAQGEPKVLLGRRHARHEFLPGKFVFPGGRVDASDRTMPVASPLHPDVRRKLLAHTELQSDLDAQALVLAAIRETFEETGLIIGAKDARHGSVPPEPWSKFVQAGFWPNPSALFFIARAITPPGFTKRFDARFFCTDRSAIAYHVKDVVHSDAELVEVAWWPISAAKTLDLPIITALVIDELQSMLHKGLRPDHAVPFYVTHDGEFTRELIA